MQRHTIEAGEKPILDIFCDKFVFRIPGYQRPYAWEVEQAAELLTDIVDACGEIGEPEDQSPYFLGSIVVIKDSQKPQADVVDGQQRLTTLTILLSVLRDLADQDIGKFIHPYIGQSGNPITGAPDVFRLTLRERDDAFFRNHVQRDGATSNLPDPRAQKDSKARIVENSIYFREKLAKLSAGQRTRLTKYIANRCYLVVVAASDQESAFRIFSVLNSRGLDLSAADILKADIIGGLQPAAAQDQYTTKWEAVEEELGRTRFADLFANLRMIHRKQKMKGTLVAEFREYVATAKQPATFIDAELLPYADAYREITDASFQSFTCSSEINRQLVYLSRLDNEDWQPPALEIIAKRRSDPVFVLRFLQDLERLAYGLFLARKDPSERIRRYGRLLSAMQAGDDVFAIGSPLQLDELEKQEVVSTLSGDIYTITRIRLPLLLRLDELLAQGSATYTHDVNSVEHVLPQNPAAGSQWLNDFPAERDRVEWVHKLANLVLLTRRKNSQASNFDFHDKKQKYFSTTAGVSNFALTSQVLNESGWDISTLERRQSDLLAALKLHWRLA